MSHVFEYYIIYCCVYFQSFLINFIFILKDQILFTAFTYNLVLPTVTTILNEFYIKVPNVFMMCLLLLGLFFFIVQTQKSQFYRFWHF